MYENALIQTVAVDLSKRRGTKAFYFKNVRKNNVGL